MKHVEYGFIGVIFAILLRILIRLGQVGYMTNDSYAYGQVARDGLPRDYSLLSEIGPHLGEYWIQVLLLILFGITVYVFYYLCREFTNPTNSLITTLMFALSPLVFFNTQIGLIDKNVYSLMMIVVTMYFMVQEETWSKWFGVSASLIIFHFMWKGAYIMTMMVFLCYLWYFWRNKKWYWLGLFSFLLAVSFFIFDVKARVLGLATGSLFGMKKELIGETRYLWNTPLHMEYFFFLLVILVLIDIYRSSDFLDDKRLTFYKIMLWVTALLSVYMFRLTIFLLPVMYLSIAIILDFNFNMEKLGLSQIPQAKTVFCVLFIIASVTSVNSIYLREPVEDAGLRETMSYVNTLDCECIASNWGKGHIYDYYTNKTVLYKGHPSQIKEMVDILVYGQETPCCIIHDKSSTPYLAFILDTHQFDNRTPFYVDTVSGKTFIWEDKSYKVIE